MNQSDRDASRFRWMAASLGILTTTTLMSWAGIAVALVQALIFAIGRSISPKEPDAVVQATYALSLRHLSKTEIAELLERRWRASGCDDEMIGRLMANVSIDSAA